MSDVTGATPPAPTAPGGTTGRSVPVDRPTRPDARVGVEVLGADYGSPYDPTAAPYPVYNDPGRKQAAEAQKLERARTRSLDGDGTAVVFTGHRSPYEGTARLVTSAGAVEVGGVIKLEDEELAQLDAMGFTFAEYGGDTEQAPSGSTGAGDIASQAAEEKQAEKDAKASTESEGEDSSSRRRGAKKGGGE